MDSLHQLTHLHTDKNRTRWTEATAFRAPHKPFLLLSILDLAAQGQIDSPIIEPSFDFIERFARYWELVRPPSGKCNMAYPFYHMQSEGFWRLVPKPGQEQELGERITSSMTRLQSVVLGAEIDQELFELISGRKSREKMRAALLNTYFAPDIRQLLLREAVENQEAYEYSQLLLQAAEAAMPFGQADKPQQIRDQGFRKAIINLYNHLCSLCGIRMITPEGHTIVEAAHIRPWADSQDNRPANGLPLCKLCYWSFDRGFMSIYENRD
ncbi:MAG: HNH endonuclease [Desulfovermiculus sp.]|nr:HNH endonuclease [Desulfovermiculus sp.]